MVYKFTLIEGSARLEINDPKGWEEINVTLTRDERWHGIRKEISLALGFYCNGGGYEFINAAYETNGADVLILLEVEYDGKLFFTGQLQLNSMVRNSYVIEVPIDNYDIGVLIERRFETPINLGQQTTLDGGTVDNYAFGNYDVQMHSRTIFLESELRQDNPFERETTQDIVFGLQYGAWINHGILSTLNDLSSIIDNPTVIDFRSGGSFLRSASNIQNFFTANDPIVEFPLNVTLEWDFSGTYTDTQANPQTRGFSGVGGWILQLHYGETLATGNQITLASINTYSGSGGTITRVFSGSGTQNIQLNAGDRIWLAWAITGGNYLVTTGSGTFPTTFKWAYDNFSLNISSNTQFRETTTKAWAIHELLGRLTHATTNEPQSIYSEYFGRTNSQPVSYQDNGCGSWLAVTNGLKLRQRTDDGSEITASLSDVMETLDSLHGVGYGILGNKLRVEPIRYFYSDDLIATFSFINEIEMRVAQNYYYNEVEIGYEKWETEDVNGLEEPNSVHIYSLPKVQRRNRYTRLSPYIGGSYAIETTRRRFGSTADYRYDNDNFILAIRRLITGGQPIMTTCEKSQLFDNVTGLLDPNSTYNLRYSPARNLIRQKGAVTAGLFRKPNEEIRFQSGEGNIEMQSRQIDICDGSYDNLILSEKQDFIAGEPLWIPEIYTFETVIPFNLFFFMSNNPYGKIAFSETDKDYRYGYILNIDWEMKTSKATVQVLRAN